MKAALARLVERVDSATLRERALVFAALALVLIFVAEAAFLGPLRARQAKLGGEIVQRQAELETVQQKLQQLARHRGEDPDAPLRERAAALRAELGALEARIAEHQRRFTPPERMREVLDELLGRHRRLALLDLKTLPAAALGEGGRAFRHGVELRVRGTYHDLFEYLAALERLPTQLYWGRAELQVGEHPVATLRLTLYTVSFDKAWLIV